MKAVLPASCTAAVPAVAPTPASLAQAAFAALLERVDYLTVPDQARLRAAYAFAEHAHRDQWRNSGEPYITHPLAVASLCAGWKLDVAALMAALLHDCMEDCGTTKADLAGRFGETVADLVEGLTKLDKLQLPSREENQAESFRKMLLAMAHDVRVILVKLADRTHNMRTMGDMPRSKWRRISSETLEIYAPMAYRLGLHRACRELQDLAFCHLHPWRHTTLHKALARWRARRQDLMQRVQDEVHAAFARLNLPMRVAARERSLYALYQHMRKRQADFSHATDVCTFRLIVPDVVDCYTALGVLHQLYKPMPGRFKDYIALAKRNGYQSLHTVLLGPASVQLDFQIRTDPMHQMAELGIASYWMQDVPARAPDGGHGVAAQGAAAQGGQPAGGMQWMRSLLDIQHETRDAAEFWHHVKMDLFTDAVYVLTPKGEVLSMPRGATVVDFAYAIHSSVGDHMTGAHINHVPAALRTELKNGDQVHIVTDEAARPNPAWLGFVRTGRARSKIRHYLKTAAQAEVERLGESLLTHALRARGLDALPQDDSVWDELLRSTDARSRSDLMADIGTGRRIATLVAQSLAEVLGRRGHAQNPLVLSREHFDATGRNGRDAVLLDGGHSSFIRYADCCHPVPGDAVLGCLDGGNVLLVHRESCRTAQRLREKNPDSLICVDWAESIDPARTFDAALVLGVHHHKGVLVRIATMLLEHDINILRLHMDDEARSSVVDMHLVIAVRDARQVDSVLHSLRQMHVVTRAERAPCAQRG